MNQLHESYFIVAKNILKYLKRTKNHEILFQVDNKGELQTYANADFAWDIDTKKLVTRFLYKFKSSPIHWNSNL